MIITVINGSPRGRYSTTLQTSLFLQKHHPEHDFLFIDAAQKIKTYEKDFTQAQDMLSKAQIIIFSYPVYTFMVPSQLEFFIDLMKKSPVDFSNKTCTQISTSKHFYDVTAASYIDENARDMGMKVVEGLLSDMDDLLTENGQSSALAFFDHLIYEARPFGIEEIKITSPVVIIADYTDDDGSLEELVKGFQENLKLPSKVENIGKYPFTGGCLGCLNCATDGKCIYKDKFDQYLRENINTASAMVYAFRLHNHSMGPVFKQFTDRQFCNGHRTLTEDTPVAYITCDNLDKEENLRLVIRARAEVGHNYLVGIATGQSQIRSLCQELEYELKFHYIKPRNFLGVGGMKIFRDLIYTMGGMMKADYKFYKNHHLFDFPQKKKALKLKMNLVGFLLSKPKIKAKMGNKINEAMVEPYKKVL